MTADREALDEVWDEFPREVNLTSRELEDWRRTASATEHEEAFPDRAGSLGHAPLKPVTTR
jgi:hypothetical protein